MCPCASIAGDVVILSLGPFALLPAPRTRARDEPHWHFLGPSFRYGVNTNLIVAVYAKCVSKHSRSCVCVPGSLYAAGTRICISAALNAYSQFMPGAAARCIAHRSRSPITPIAHCHATLFCAESSHGMARPAEAQANTHLHTPWSDHHGKSEHDRRAIFLCCPAWPLRTSIFRNPECYFRVVR